MQIGNLSLRALRYLVAVAEAQSLTAAARRLNVSQPSLSEAVAGLEREMGIALFLVWREGLDRPEVKVAIYIFALQFVFNIAWSGAFFGLRSPYYGLIVIVLLWLMILLTIFKFWQVSRNAALLLVPYILWVSFAMALNYNIMVLNP